MRIFHLEDEWFMWRTIPHHLFDRLFDLLPAESKIELEPAEQTGAESRFSYSFFARDLKEGREYFSYHFIVPKLEALKDIEPTNTDVFILDVLDVDDKGRPVPIVRPLLASLTSRGVKLDRCRYFSAYPGEFPSDVACSGFSKGESQELIGCIFDLLKPDL